MRRVLAAIALSTALTATPALAQDAEPDLGAAQRALSDPVKQEQMAHTIAVLGEVLLDLPLAPLAQAAAEMSGQDPDAIDPDMTLRSVAPEAEDAPAELAEKLPRAMDSLAGMLGGLEAMLPALRDLADRVENSIPQE